MRRGSSIGSSRCLSAISGHYEHNRIRTSSTRVVERNGMISELLRTLRIPRMPAGANTSTFQHGGRTEERLAGVLESFFECQRRESLLISSAGVRFE
jgi:hypothetical protein